VMTALKLSAALSTCDRAMKATCSTERSAAKYSWNWLGSRYVKPSAVFFIAPDLLRSLGKRFPSSASFSPASGMCAATYTNPATDGSVSGCFVPTLYDFLCECRVQVHRCTDHMGSDFDLAPVKNFEERRQTLFVAA